MEAYIILFAIFFIIFFLLYLVYDLATTTTNAFQDKWTKKMLWLWLPIYAFWRLVREVVFGKK
jgi:hypothetical protein